MEDARHSSVLYDVSTLWFAGVTRARRIRPGGGGWTQEQCGGTAGQGGPLRKQVSIVLKLFPYFFAFLVKSFPYYPSFPIHKGLVQSVVAA